MTAKKTRDVINPFNGETIAVVAESSRRTSTKRCAPRGRHSIADLGGNYAQQRGRILFAMADLVRKHRRCSPNSKP